MITETLSLETRDTKWRTITHIYTNLHSHHRQFRDADQRTTCVLRLEEETQRKPLKQRGNMHTLGTSRIHNQTPNPRAMRSLCKPCLQLKNMIKSFKFLTNHSIGITMLVRVRVILEDTIPIRIQYVMIQLCTVFTSILKNIL